MSVGPQACSSTMRNSVLRGSNGAWMNGLSIYESDAE